MTIRLCEGLKYNDIKGEKVKIGCRIPSKDEIHEYFTKIRNAGKNNKRIHNLLMHFGLRIMNRLEEGHFEIEKDGQFVPLTSDSNSQYYDPKWRQYLIKYIPKHVKSLVVKLFEGR